MKKFDYEQVKNPIYFSDGCVKPHSDHTYYKSYEEMENEETSFRFSLNGLWKFHYALNYDQSIKGFELNDYSCKDWNSIRVPAHIQLEGYDVPQYVNIQYPWEGHEQIEPPEIPKKFNPVASYVKYFYLPENMKNAPLFIAFEGAESAMALWVNGEFVGYHEDSFTPAEFDISAYIVDGENKIAVQVFKWSSGSWCEDQDFWRFSGLYRDVYLYTVPKCHIFDLKISTNLLDDFKKSELLLDLKLSQKAKARLLLAYKNESILDEEVDLNKDLNSLKYSILNPHLWSAEAPDLYDLIIELRDDGGNIQEIISERVGFRRFEIKDSIMLLNGKRLVFKGVNRHEFSSINGRYVTKADMVKDIINIKCANINAIRTSHYPNSSLLYKLCDIYGIYLIDEANLETHGSYDTMTYVKDYERAVPRDNQIWRHMLLARAEAMYERDKNHASVLIWSCGNESAGGKVIFDMAQFFKEVDNRPVHYENVWTDRRFDISDIESRMYIPVNEIEEFLDEHKDKPYICCEYSHAMGNSCGAIHKYMDLAYRNELFHGGFIWDYIDQSITSKNKYGETYQAYGGDFGDTPNDFNFCGNGIVYGDSRNNSPKVQEIKFVYQSIDVNVSKNEISVFNKNLFLGTDSFDCTVVLEKEGKQLKRALIDTCVQPLEKGVYTLPEGFIINKSGEYVITVSFSLKEDTLWAKKGYEIAFGQYVYKVRSDKRPEICKDKSGMELVKSIHNIGVSGEDFEVIFSLLSGGMVSYKYGNVQLIKNMPKPNFWRAPTDNDSGNLMQMRYAQWKIASLYCAAKKIDDKSLYPLSILPRVYETDNSYVIEFTYALPTSPESECTLSYEVFADALVKMCLKYEPNTVLCDMPEFGVLFTLDSDYEYVKWYGLGYEETYADRKLGARLGVYSNRVADNMAKYLMPQECGNKEEVRYARVTDIKGRGLVFTAGDDEAMSFSALPYTPHQIETANHLYELPKVYNTIVRVSKAQMGVGGDDSWGARTHNEYLLPRDKELKFEFSFKGI